MKTASKNRYRDRPHSFSENIVYDFPIGCLFLVYIVVDIVVYHVSTKPYTKGVYIPRNRTPNGIPNGILVHETFRFGA